MSESIVLADNAITQHDRLVVELHRPLEEPAFVLLQWPAQASVLAADPRAVAAVARAVVRVLAAAQTKLALS
jgi:hypothetical protein